MDDEEKGGRISTAALAVWPWQGHVRPDWLCFLMEADLERRPPLSDDVASGRQGHSPHGRGRRQATTHEQWGVLKGQFAHITKPALCCFFCANFCLGDLPKWLQIIYHYLKLCLSPFFIFPQLGKTHSVALEKNGGCICLL